MIPEKIEKGDFKLKISMKDHLWDTLNDNELDKLDKFERLLDAEIYDKFKEFVKYDSCVIII